jgi:NADPH:quinone reductase
MNTDHCNFNSPGIDERGYMRALILDQVGGAFRDVVVPRPSLKSRQILVRVYASGVNPLDSKIRLGMAPHARHPLPNVLGMDMAGVVAAVGRDVRKFQVGDEVYGLVGGVGGRQGTLAEFVAVEADLLAHKPSNLSMRQAAALPLVLITAWEGLVDRASIRPGQKVLVHGGAGGVGHIAIQLAAAFGAEVFATGRPGQVTVIESLGARFIDHTISTVEQYVREYTGGDGFDIIYDTLGGDTLDQSFAAVRIYGGHVVSCLGWGEHKLAPLSFRAATYSGVFTLLPMLTGHGLGSHGEILQQAASLIERRKITPLMDPRRYSWGGALLAHQAVELGKTQGRIVVDILSDASPSS